MLNNPEKPYNNLPPLPPKCEVETKLVLKQAISAHRALAELKGLCGTIPNPGILIDSLTLQEAKESSAIENIVTTNDKLYMSASSGKSSADPAIQEIMRYKESLWNACERQVRGSRLDSKEFIRIAKDITGDARGIRKSGKTAIGNTATKQIVYTPPAGEKIIKDKLMQLEAYMQDNSEEDPLVKLALSHYQFEAIHPFHDGNGRTGRIINSIFLVSRGLIDLPVLYMSSYINAQKPQYYALLRLITERGRQNDWEAWTLFILRCLEETSISTVNRIRAIRRQMEDAIELAQRKMKSKYSKELIELVFRQPYSKGQMLVDEKLAERKTAAVYLKELEELGILDSEKVGKERLYLNKSLFKALTE